MMTDHHRLYRGVTITSEPISSEVILFMYTIIIASTPRVTTPFKGKIPILS